MTVGERFFQFFYEIIGKKLLFPVVKSYNVRYN